MTARKKIEYLLTKGEKIYTHDRTNNKTYRRLVIDRINGTDYVDTPASQHQARVDVDSMFWHWMQEE